MEVKGHLLSRSCCSTNLNFAALLGFFSPATLNSDRLAVNFIYTTFF